MNTVDPMLTVLRKADEAFRTREQPYIAVDISLSSQDEVECYNHAVIEKYFVQEIIAGKLLRFTDKGRNKLVELGKTEMELAEARKANEIAENALSVAKKANFWSRWAVFVAVISASIAIASWFVR